MPDEEKKEKKTEKKKDLSSWFRVNGQEATEEEFVSWLIDQKEEHPVVLQHHGKWKELIGWEKGYQFSVWNESEGMLKHVNLNLRKSEVIINLLKPLVETIEGKVNFYNKKAGMPNSSEQKDINGARVASTLIEYNDYVNSEDELMEELKYDLFRTGQACKKWIFDKTYSGFMVPKKNGKVDKKEKPTEAPGEVIGEVVPIFNIRPDPTAKEMSKCRWFMEIKEITLADLLSTYKVKEEDIEREEKPGGPAAVGDKYRGMNEDEDEKDLEEETRVIGEFWEIPTEHYKNGRFVVIDFDDRKIVHAQSNESPDSALPYFMYYYKKTPYSFWAMGPLHFVQDIQRNVNRRESMISDHVEAWRPKMSVGRGALTRAGSMVLDNFELVEVDYSRGEPKPMTMPELSPQVPADRDFLISSLDRVSNIHEVSYSRLPQYASRAPASLYSMMLEQENIKMGPMVSRWNKTIVDEARFRLKLMDKYYDQPRMVKIMGPNKESYVAYFDKTDLSENYDIRLEIGVTLNQSTTIQLRSLIEFYDKGIITDKNKIIRAANLGMAELEFRTDIVDTERAMRENQAFMDGTDKELKTFKAPPIIIQAFEQLGMKIQETEVYVHDDHVTHLESHTNLLKSEDAEKWPDKQFQALDQHVLVHLLFQQALAPPPPAQPGQQPGQGGQTPGAPQEGGGAPGRPVSGEGAGMGEAIEGGNPEQYQ